MKEVFIHTTAQVSEQATIGKGTKIWNWVQVQDNSKIGENCILGKGVYIDSNVKIGNNVKIENNVSVYHGVTIEDGVFVGPHVCFTNDKIPRAINVDGTLKSNHDWKVSETRVKEGAAIGANSTILPGITIGEFALIGSGSVVTEDVPRFSLVYGNPARVHSYVCKCGNKLSEENNFCNICKINLIEIKK